MYQHLNGEIKLAAGCLSTVNFLCRKNGWSVQMVSTEEFCRVIGSSVDTADRVRERILDGAGDILGRKREPKAPPEAEQGQIAALVEYLHKQGVRWDEQGRIGRIPDEARCRIVAAAEQMKRERMRYKDFCRCLGINTRTLRKLRGRYDVAEELGGLARKSRRPHEPSQETPKDLVDLICAQWKLQLRLNGHLTVTEYAHWFNDRFKDRIRRLTEDDPRCSGRESVSLKTIIKHLKKWDLYRPGGKQHYEGVRGAYEIFGALLQGAMDTTTLKFFGKIFKWINFFDIGSRTTVAENVSLKERATDAVKVYEQARVKCPEMVGEVHDGGKVYMGDALRDVMRQDEQGEEFIRVCARPGRGEEKAHLERHFRTTKEWLAGVEQMVMPLCEELEGLVEGVEEKTRQAIWCVVVGMVLRVGEYFVHRMKQEHIDGLSPIERLELPAKVSRQEAVESLSNRAERNKRKKEVLDELIDELGFTKPSQARQFRRLRNIRIEALQAAKERLRWIRTEPRVNETRDNFNYFAGTAEGIAGDIRRSELRQNAQEARTRREIEKSRRERECLEKQRQFSEANPEKVLPGQLEGFIKVLDGSNVKPEHWTCLPISGLVKRSLRSLAEKFDGLFDLEVEMALQRMRYLAGSDRAKEAISEFVCRTALDVRGDAQAPPAPPTMAPG